MSTDEDEKPHEMGEVSFQDDGTVYLKPSLLTKRQKWQRNHSLWSHVVGISPLLLWCYGLLLLSHPVSVLVLRKYQEDFQTDWHEYLLLKTNLHLTMYTQFLYCLRRAGVAILDVMAGFVLDSSPPLTATALFLHLAICLGYLAFHTLTVASF